MAESQRPTQCVVIKKNVNSAPPDYTIPFNDNSTRAQSKKHRIYVLRDFLFRTYPSSLARDCTVLDVAGGRGDLSWILRNVDGVNSIIADPRIPNHRRLVKSVNFLLDHPEEAAIRSVEGLPTHQPLAKLLPRLIANHGTSDACADLSSPKYLRIHVDDALVETQRKILLVLTPPGKDDSIVWDEYWGGEQCRIESNKIYYGGTAPKTTSTENNQITDSRLALEVFQSLDLIVGFHPDQATESTIDLALLLKIPFCVVPCCVFPSEFPTRNLNGKRVRTHGELLEYLCAKHDKIRKEKLPFVETDTAKNVALYMLKDDYL
eukprot:CAMPEP_0172329958 /NCGR_PEP_ID=MMETSP1058-20130122/61151_1 /TAXON_ID=83371 /ORGANISM="Detonula confervacea, Strain CCMP 353" /LENGTH=319 /DNA_ID=CAMNT_0013047153 /DNA_START=188 /DNA_END=1147 /DNA_ORIENTATION=+